MVVCRTTLSPFLVVSGCDFWLVRSVDSNPFPECPLPAEESAVQVEISQVAESAKLRDRGVEWIADSTFSPV
jgi:hypothetical protein